MASAAVGISVFPGGEIAGGFAQGRRFGAERRQRSDGVMDDVAEVSARRLNAEDRDQGLLVEAGVLLRRLAERGGRGGDVEQVVGELEGAAGGFGVGGEMAECVVI